MTIALLLSGWALCGALTSPPDEGALAEYERALAAARLPAIELELVDGHLAFERALHGLLARGSADGERLALVREALSTSPVALPRSYTDGREPTGWDLAQSLAQSELMARRPDLRQAVTQVTRSLSPDVWRVAEGCEQLAELCRQAVEEPAVAALVYQSADRLAPFPQYHDALSATLTAAEQGAREQDAGPAVEHQLALARLRLSAGTAAYAASDADRAPWQAAARSAPNPWQSELVELAGLVQRARLGDPAQRARARDELAAFVGKTPFPDLALRAGEQLVRRWLTVGELTQALGWCALLQREGATPEQLAGLRLIMVRDGQSLLADQPDAVLDQLQAQLEHSLVQLADAPAAPALTWAAATLAEARERPERAAELLVASAAATLDGVEPPARLAPRSEWWLPLAEPAVEHLRPAEFSRASCWQLAELAWEARRWEDVLRYGAYPAPAEGCGNVVVQAERHGLRRRAAALEGLGRHEQARGVRGDLVLSAGWDDITRSVAELVEHALATEDAGGLRAWLERNGPAQDDRLEQAGLLLDFRLALRDGPRAEAERLGAELGQRWPGDQLLTVLVRDGLAGDG